jgi:serine protease AprX
MIVSGGLVLVGATAVDPARAAVAAPPAATGIDVVVLGEGRGLAAAAVRRSGGTVVRRLPTIAGVTATIPSSALRSLRAASGVTGVTVDRRYELRGESSRGTDPGSSLRDIRALSGVDRLAGEARGGAGVDVAVVDSGVARVDGLDAPDKVVDAPDFSDDRTEPALKGHDGFGHGTHLAGVIAADDENAGLIGMAPDARILDVKVADHAGGTSLSQLLAGIDWVVRNRDRGGLDIRVMNLAFGADVDGASYRTDPLAYAVEQAWRRGIVVVTAAGNGGVDSGGLDSPAHDPYVLAVGATDTAGTADAR